MNVKIGKITHYYDKIGVAVLTTGKKPLKVGDTVKISGHDKEFTQVISSILIEHEQIDETKSGQSVGVKVDQPVKEGDLVYRVA